MQFYAVTFALFALAFPAFAADFDGDGVADEIDNCITRKNPLQQDYDFDLYGNWCDTDLDNTKQTTVGDFVQFKVCLQQFDAGRCYNSACDFDSNGVVDAKDFARLSRDLDSGRAPGPSGLKGETP